MARLQHNSLLYDSNSESISSNKTLLQSDPQLQFITPSSELSIILCAPDDGLFFYIMNKSTEYDLNIEYNFSIIGTVKPGGISLFLCNKTQWEFGNLVGDEGGTGGTGGIGITGGTGGKGQDGIIGSDGADGPSGGTGSSGGTGGVGGAGAAYDNTNSGLSATTFNDAIDELTDMFDKLKLSNIIYVSKSGSNIAPATGQELGSINYPYLTIQEAIDNNSNCVIFILPGTYDELLTISSGVSLIAYDPRVVVGTASGNHVVDFSNVGGDIFLKNIEFKDSNSITVNHDINTNSANLVINNCTLPIFTAYGKGINDTITILNQSEFTDDLNIHAFNVLVNDSTVYGDINIDDDNTGIATAAGWSARNIIKTTEFENLNVSNPNSTYLLTELIGCICNSQTTANGVGVNIYYDLASATSSSSNMISVSGGNLVKTDNAYAIKYIPTTSSDWNGSITTIKQGLDELASRLRSAGY